LKVPLRQLERHLADRLAKVYLVAGDEPLLVDEALERIRVAARAADFTSRELHAAERSFRWADLEAGTDNLSLFATRKIVEIRLATPRPGDEGGRTIARLCAREDPDTLLIVAIGQKLDSAASRSAWVKAIDQRGAIVEIWPIERAELPRWIQQRATSVRLKLTTAAAQSLAERVEGNLLAADQEIKRLALAAEGREVDEGEVLEFVANNSRFDIFGLADAVLAGETGRAFKILAGLRAEGVQPVQISWVLNRDISLLARLEYAVRHGDNVEGALMRTGVWRRRQPLVKQALRRFRASRLRALIVEAARVDAALKGVFPAEPWTTLTDLLISLLRPAEGARAR
jgi:DNA polymerase III subunit delta